MKKVNEHVGHNQLFLERKLYSNECKIKTRKYIYAKSNRILRLEISQLGQNTRILIPMGN